MKTKFLKWVSGLKIMILIYYDGRVKGCISYLLLCQSHLILFWQYEGSRTGFIGNKWAFFDVSIYCSEREL
jgi:hypothetical protein